MANTRTAKGKNSRGSSPRQVGKIVGGLSKRAFGRRGFLGGEIIAEWPKVVGEQMANLSCPERILYPSGKRSGGTLHLRIASGSIAVELQHLEPVLLERINGYLGYKAVEKVHLIQAPVDSPDARKESTSRRVDPENLEQLMLTLTDVDDPDLKSSLERLARAMAIGKQA